MRLLPCVIVSLMVASGAAEASARAEAIQQKRLDRGRSSFEKLRGNARKAKHRDAWEHVIRELDSAVRLAPEGKAAPAAALLAAKARVALFEASRSPADAKAALSAFRKVDEAYPGPVGKEALISAVQVALHTKDAGDRRAAAKRLAERYPESPEGKHWAARLGGSAKKPVVVAPASKSAPVAVKSDDESDDEEGDEPAAAPVAEGKAPPREPNVDVGGETAKIVQQMIEEARAGHSPAAASDGQPAAAAAPSGKEAAAQPEPSAKDDGDQPPEPEETDAPPPPSAPFVRAMKDAVAALTEPEEPVTPGRARELRSEALRSGSIAEQLGLKVRRIVIDAGHGGKDTGAIGPHGLREKDAALAIAKKVAERLEALGFQVILTRKRDVYVPLEDRTRIANEAKADLFVSIHCNAARKRTLQGVETWTLNVSSDRYATRLARFENAEAERTVSDLRMILADLATKANAGDARDLARSVQSSLVRTLRTRVGKVTDHGVKQALFYVLLGTHMPSVLVETAFISNPGEEQRLRSSRFQDGTADAIARGVKDFVDARRQLAKAL